MIRRLCLTAALGVMPLAAIAADAPKAAPAPAAKAAAPAAPAPAAAAPAPMDDTSVHLKIPLFSDAFSEVPAASVEGDPITMAELTDALAITHQGREGHAEKGDVTRKLDVMPVLERLIDVRLLAVEARNMGMDTLPEFEKAVSEFKEATGQEMLKQRHTREIQGDPAMVDRIYKDAVQRWSVRSLLFANESDAIRLKAETAAGKSFEDVAKQAVADGKAKGGDAPQDLTRATALAHVVALLEKTKAGEVTPPVRLQEGWAVLKLEKVEFPESAKELDRARNLARVEAQKAALRKYYDEISKRFAVVDQKLFKALDFEKKKPGIAVLKKDKRVVAKIKGGKDITVGDLATTLEAGFFHGMESAIKKQSVNRQKLEVFDGLLAQRIVPLEVKRLGIEQTPEYVRRVTSHRNGLLFSSFLTKVIAPKVQITDDVIRKYHEEHRKEFTYPGFYRLESLAFATAKEAQAALDKLASGTDFKWLNANSAQLKPGERKANLAGLLADTALPKELLSALSGAKPGDYRLYADPSNQFYAVHVVEILAPQEQPFEEARGKIHEKLFYDAVNEALKDWTGKLRKATDVKVFITRIGS